MPSHFMDERNKFIRHTITVCLLTGIACGVAVWKMLH